MTHIAQYQKDPSVTPFGNLRLHIQRHAYKKGRHAGAAPADSSRRGKSHFRVEQRAAAIAVVFHYTDILIAYEDGSIKLDSGGYETSPTTRAALEDALWLAGYKGWLRSARRNGYLNTTINLSPARGGAWIRVGWADGITISPTGEVTGYAPIKAYRADKEARKAWREQAQPFKEMLPILLAGLENQARVYPSFRVYDVGSAALNPESWPELARHLAYRTGYDAATAWAYLDREATENMRVIVNDE